VQRLLCASRDAHQPKLGEASTGRPPPRGEARLGGRWEIPLARPPPPGFTRGPFSWKVLFNVAGHSGLGCNSHKALAPPRLIFRAPWLRVPWLQASGVHYRAMALAVPRTRPMRMRF